MEIDNTTSKNSRNKKKRSSRRSSILKINTSPVRTALGDLDPNHVKEGTREAKSKRLSKRVSFADTLSVREFLNDTDAHTLGLLKNSPHGKQDELPSSSETGTNEVTGPTIQGLDSLLSAPIKTPSEQNTLPDMIHLDGEADCQTKEMTMTMDFTQTHGTILTKTETDNTRQRWPSSSSDTSDTSIHHEMDVPNPTFVGPTYSCLMPASFNSSTTTEPSDVIPKVDDMEQTRVFQNDDTTGFMELTTCYGGLMDSSTTEQINKKMNTSSFLQSLSKPSQKKSNTSDFLQSLMNPKPGFSNLQSEQRSLQEGYNNHISSNICGREQTNPRVDVNQLIHYKTDIEVIPSTGIDKENEIHSRLLAARRKSDEEIAVEETRVFSNDEQADMDMTGCVASVTPKSPDIPTGGSQSRTRPEDQTRLFTTDEAGLMEMTTCVGNVMQTTTSQDLIQKMEDRTVMFATDSGDADMDETASLGQIQLSSNFAGIQQCNPPFQNKSLSIIQEAEDENISRRNSNIGHCSVATHDNEGLNATAINEFTIGVDFTANVGQLIKPKFTSTPFHPSIQNSFCLQDVANDTISTGEEFSDKKTKNVTRASLSSSGEVKPETPVVPSEKTTIFGEAENTGRMDITSCVGGLLPITKTEDSVMPAEKTTIFGEAENTGRMDITSCVGGLLPITKTEDSVMPAEKTTLFGEAENTGRMDITSCVGGLLATTKTEDSVMPAEKTTIFGVSENTGRMDMTSCVGGLLATTKTEDSVMPAEKTTIFGVSENTGRMDITSCVGGLLATSKTEEVMPAERTTIFGVAENTGRMDMTSCIGGLLSTSKTEEPVMPAERTTVFGVAENTGKMEMTSCVGGLLPTCNTENPICEIKTTADMTTLFGMAENTGRMELTSCVGGLVPENQVNISVSDRIPSAECNVVLLPTNERKIRDKSKISDGEKTIVFCNTTENTGKMDFTSCVGGVDNNFNENSPVDTEIDDYFPAINNYFPVITRMFGSEDVTEKMELTSTVENHLQQSLLTESERNIICGNDIVTPDDVKICSPEKILDVPGSDTKITSGSTSAVLEPISKNTANDDLPVQVLDKEIMVGYSEVSSNGDDILGSTDKDWSAGTFTITTDGADTFTLPNGPDLANGETDQPQEVSGSKRKHDSSFESQSKLIKTDFNETGLGEHGVKGILEELPPKEIDDLENLDLTAGTTFFENDIGKQIPNSLLSEAGRKSNLSKSLMERTENFSFMNLTKPAGSEITVGEFLESFFDNLTSLPSVTNIRRSLMPVVQGSEPTDLASRLRASCIDTPKCQMYEWAVEYVSQNTDKMEKSVLELTEKLFAKDEMNDKLIVGSDEMIDLDKRVQKLHQVCKKEMKTSWKEWKSKMLSSMLTSITERHDHLQKIVKNVKESSMKIDNDIQQLEKFENDLDDAISELESFELPNEGEQLLLSEQQSKLSRLQAELEAAQNNQSALQKQKEQLMKDENQLKAELIELEEKKNIENSIVVSDKELQIAYNKLKRLERLCEGKIKEWDDSGCAIAFLYDSLWLKITYSGPDPNDLEEKLISSMNFESYLESSSALSAHLSHVMVQEAIDLATLLQKYPTTKDLPKMLEELCYVVSLARCLERDIRHVQFWHIIEIHNKKVTVEFSNMQAFAKFYVTFELVPSSCATTPFVFTFKNKIGDVSENDIKNVLSGVNMGFGYLQRLVQAIDDFLKTQYTTDNSEDSDGS